MSVEMFLCRPAGEMMGFQPARNGQYDGYHEMTYQQQGMCYPSQIQTCTSAGNRIITYIESCIMFFTLLASCSAVYCNQCCLCVFVGGSVTTITRNCVHRSCFVG